MNPNYELYKHHKLCYSILQQCRDKLKSKAMETRLTSEVVNFEVDALTRWMAHHRTEYRKYNGGVS